MNAPILITVYNRLDLLKRCIDSLKKCKESKDSILYISSDAAYQESDIDKIDEIRNFASKVKGFKDVVLLFKSENQGSYKSVHNSMEFVLDKHDCVVFLEDDNEVNEHFLTYMNNSLVKYSSNENIHFICSYLFPNCNPLLDEDVFLWGGFSPWGFATWKKSWKRMNFDPSRLYSHNYKYLDMIKLWFIDPRSLSVVMLDKSKSIAVTDARICFNLMKIGGYSIFPSKGISVNRGHDGSGEHESLNDIYLKQELSVFSPSLPVFIDVNKRLLIFMFFHRLNLSSIYHLLKYLFNFIKVR